MYETLALIGLAVWLGLPAWIANSMPVLFGGGPPIDGGRVFRDGHRILGDGKTIRGFIVGVLLGTLTGVGQIFAAPHIQTAMESCMIVTPDMMSILYMPISAAFFLSLGALIGDLIGSFFKRRIDIKSGNPAPVLDQLGFIIMALALAAPFLQAEAIYVIILVTLTLGIHWISNAMGYLLGLKEHPW